MIHFDSDCEWWVLVGVGSFLLLILSEILPIIRPVHQGADEEEAQRVHGIVQFMTLIIRTQWVRHHPMIREFLRFTRDVVAEQNIPPSPSTESPEVVLEGLTPLSVEVEDLVDAEDKDSETVVSLSAKTVQFKPIDEGKD